MSNVIDAVKPLDGEELSGLERDVRTVKGAAWHAVNGCRALLRTTKRLAEAHGLTALKAGMTANEIQAVTQTIVAAKQLIAVLGPSYDPGDIPNDPLPLPEPEEP